MNSRLTQILEFVWLSLALLAFFAGLFNWYKQGIGESVMFFIISLISLMMYFYRRRLRKQNKP